MQRFGLPTENKKRKTPQTEAIPGREQEVAKNNAGGFSFVLDCWKTLERFLILGTSGGTYYVSENKLNKDNTAVLNECLDKDYKRTIDMIADISYNGRAMRNDVAIFALAVAATHANVEARSYAMQNFEKVCRIGTHVLHFASYMDSMRGWGRAVRNGVNRWYTSKENDLLIFQLLKYQSRDGWAHRDVLRLAHTKPKDEIQGSILGASVGKKEWPNIGIAQGYNALYTGEKDISVNEVISIINKYNVPREIIPTGFLNEPAVWMAMLPNMPITAMVRNLGKMGSLGILGQMSKGAKIVIDKFTNDEVIRKSRIHPMALLNAIKVYSYGTNVEGANYGRIMAWNPNARIIEAMEHAFYASFGNIEPSGKNIMLALDVSGSMTCKMSNSLVSCREASAVMAMATARVEKNYGIYGFTARGQNFVRTDAVLNNSLSRSGYTGGNGISELAITPNMSFNQVIAYISGLGFCSTDCSLPMMFARTKKLDVDLFAVYTDNETYAGCSYPSQELATYRNVMNKKAKSVVVGMTATNFTIADPKDAGMLDVVGFDTNTPALISSFAMD